MTNLPLKILLKELYEDHLKILGKDCLSEDESEDFNLITKKKASQEELAVSIRTLSRLLERKYNKYLEFLEYKKLYKKYNTFSI